MAVHAPFYKANCAKETFLIRGTRKFFASRRRYFFVVIARLGCTHPSQWRHRAAPTPANSRERARDYVTRSVQQPLEPESSSYSFFFRVLQFLKFIREFRRDETRLFSNEPLLPRLPIADSKIDPPLPGEIRIRAKRRARWKWERLQFVLSGIKFDLINRKELELIFIFFFFHSYSFNQSWEFLFGFLLDSFWSDLGDWGIRFRKFKKTAIDEIRHVLKEQCDSF